MSTDFSDADAQSVSTEGSQASHTTEPTPVYAVVGMSLRELLVGGLFLLAFIVSFFGIASQGVGSVWTFDFAWILTMALPGVAAFLIVLRRFSPNGIRRVGSLGIDQFASVAMSVALVSWFQLLVQVVRASTQSGSFLLTFVIPVEIALFVALVLLTVFGRFLPRVQEDFVGRTPGVAHPLAGPARDVVARPRTLRTPPPVDAAGDAAPTAPSAEATPGESTATDSDPEAAPGGVPLLGAVAAATAVPVLASGVSAGGATDVAEPEDAEAAAEDRVVDDADADVDAADAEAGDTHVIDAGAEILPRAAVAEPGATEGAEASHALLADSAADSSAVTAAEPHSEAVEVAEIAPHGVADGDEMPSSEGSDLDDSPQTHVIDVLPTPAVAEQAPVVSAVPDFSEPEPEPEPEPAAVVDDNTVAEDTGTVADVEPLADAEVSADADEIGHADAGDAAAAEGDGEATPELFTDGQVTAEGSSPLASDVDTAASAPLVDEAQDDVRTAEAAGALREAEPASWAPTDAHAAPAVDFAPDVPVEEAADHHSYATAHSDAVHEALRAEQTDDAHAEPVIDFGGADEPTPASDATTRVDTDTDTDTDDDEVVSSEATLTEQIAILGFGEQVPTTAHASGGSLGIDTHSEEDAAPVYSRRSRRHLTDTGDLSATGDVFDSGPVSPDDTATMAHEPVSLEPQIQPFWALAPTDREVLDASGAPIFRVGPTEWTLVLEDRGGAYVVRHDDGRIGFLHEIDDMIKG